MPSSSATMTASASNGASDFQASPNVKNINEFSKSQSFRTKMKRLEYKLDRKKSKYMRSKLLQDTAMSGVSSTCPWITGGSIGSRSAVLVFKTSALSNHADIAHQENHDPCTSGSSLPKTKRENPAAVKNVLGFDKRTYSESIEKKLLATNFDLYRRKVQLTKPTRNESLSSSENSISSACDDPADVEADIAHAESHENTDSIEHGHEGDEENEELNKDMVSNDVQEDTARSEMPAAILNITFKFTNTETKLLKRILASHGLREANESGGFNLLWTGLHMKPDILRSLKPYQRVNHFPRSYELTRKDRLYKNIEKMQHLRGMKNFDIVPLSFMLPLEYRNLVSAHRSGHRGPWIVKPAASSRGRGIYLVNTPEQIPLDDQVIVSKYIADPLCIDGHKCDVRLYVAVTSFDPLLIYMYEEGLVRLATVKYDKTAENLWNPCMHLCNYSINKYHSDYIKATESDEDVGHKWTFSALLRHLKSQGSDVKVLMQNIEDVICKSIFACSQSIVSACRMFVPNGNNCFELYGFDILIDNTLKPWLLEVNLSPSLGIDTPLDAKVKSSLLADLLTLVGIPALSPLSRVASDSKWSRFKSKAGRRTLTELSTNSTNNKRTTIGLTAEENRVVRNARAQYARRGGFVRIFPVDDSMQKYGMFLDSATGIPVSIVNSTSLPPGQTSHNFNQMLYSQLYGNRSTQGCIVERMLQYERTLEMGYTVQVFASTPPKCQDEARRLRKQLGKLMESGNELTLLQARKIFATFLECILKRLSHEPKNHHEKLILKFITRSDLSIKPPNFMKNPHSSKVPCKDRSAIVAKLLGDYLEAFNRDTDACVDNYDYYGLIPSQLFDDFLAQALESDLESILSLHVNLTQNLSFLFNRSTGTTNVPTAPPIPTGANGFLKALPNMAPNITSRDLARIDSYYKSLCSATGQDDDGVEVDKTAATRCSNPSLCPAKKRIEMV